MLYFRVCKRCPFGTYAFFRLHFTSGLGANFMHPHIVAVFEKKNDATKTVFITILNDLKTTYLFLYRIIVFEFPVVIKLYKIKPKLVTFNEKKSTLKLKFKK